MGKTDTAGAEAPAKATAKVVKYVGTADVREIDANAWKRAGIEDQGKVVWDRKNRWQVPVSELTDGAVRYCDEDDAGFVVTEA